MASHTCIVCEKLIKGATSKAKGQDCVFCEGTCQGWIHRQCAGIPKPVFNVLSQSQEPFLCLYCSSLQIHELKRSVQSLQDEIATLKSQIPANVPSLPASSTNADSLPVISSYASIVSQSSQENPSHSISSTPQANPVPVSPNQKFNFVVYGINEPPKGSPRHSRLINDNNAVAEVVKKLDDTIPDLSIQDCTRLGRFTAGRNWPILVKMSRSCEVSSILSQRRKLQSCPGIFIKPDMSPTERKIESLLMTERWELIQSGIPKDQIKVKGNVLFVNSKNLAWLRI